MKSTFLASAFLVISVFTSITPAMAKDAQEFIVLDANTKFNNGSIYVSRKTSVYPANIVNNVRVAVTKSTRPAIQSVHAVAYLRREGQSIPNYCSKLNDEEKTKNSLYLSQTPTVQGDRKPLHLYDEVVSVSIWQGTSLNVYDFAIFTHPARPSEEPVDILVTDVAICTSYKNGQEIQIVLPIEEHDYD